ncbi:hypothetical protein TYRP_021035 [Tyrophagus putrescentiae]|nr:hypothetical protein TYRP_021035 [Tyrophagus putrescentiae]
MKFFKVITTIFYRLLAIIAFFVAFFGLIFSGEAVSGAPLPPGGGAHPHFPSCVISSFVKETQACHEAFGEDLKKDRIGGAHILVKQCCALEEYRLCLVGVSAVHCAQPKDRPPFVEYYLRLARAGLALREHDAQQLCAEHIGGNGTAGPSLAGAIELRCGLQEKVANKGKVLTETAFLLGLALFFICLGLQVPRAGPGGYVVAGSGVISTSCAHAAAPTTSTDSDDKSADTAEPKKEVEELEMKDL